MSGYAPSAREAIDRILVDFRNTVHTSFPARVLSYDAAAQTIEARPALLREVNPDPDEPELLEDFEELPDLTNVQVMWPRAGGFVLTFPLKPGDWVLVVCAEQSTMLWRQKGSTGARPGISDPHGLNGLVALPGWFPDAEKLANVSTTDLVLGRLDDDATVRIKPDGTVVLGGESGAGYAALAARVDTLFKTFVEAKPGVQDSGLAIQAAVKTVWNSLGATVAAEKVKIR